METNKLIDIVVGARPNYIKAFPIYKKLKEDGSAKIRLINTGQHFDKNMSKIFFDQLGIPIPDINLKVGSGTHGEQTAKIIERIERVFINNKPNLVIVFGDVNSTVAAALAASKLHIPIAHVEAGLRSFDRSMPEEINRVITDQISDILFITSPEAQVNLINEGKDKEQIYYVGNTMIDTLIEQENKFNGKTILKSIKVEKNQFVLVTLHRPSNVDSLSSLKKIIKALNVLSERLPVLWIVHPRVKKSLNEISIVKSKSLFFIDPLGYFEFLGLQKAAKLIITDSGGVQEESSYFGTPCLTIRENTERPITIKEGTNKLIGILYDNIIEEANIKLSTNIQSVKTIIKWDGKASERIYKILKDLEYL
jgi:UDP-N-acetylglucosamine 2-epimerase (non-hydrolysing)